MLHKYNRHSGGDVKLAARTSFCYTCNCCFCNGILCLVESRGFITGECCANGLLRQLLSAPTDFEVPHNLVSIRRH